MKKNISSILITFITIMLLSGGLISCGSSSERKAEEIVAEHNVLTEAEIEEGWILMFDGETSDGWRGYNRNDFPEGWVIEEGTMHCTGTGGDVIYDQKFIDFHLIMDWKISEGGNSGIFFLAQEIEGRPIWHTAPEYQLLDNEAYTELNSDQYAPSLYDLVPPMVQNTRPAGEWNTAEIVLHNGHLTMYQNGEEVVHVHMDDETWETMVDESKFPLELFGKLEPGYIGVQDHGDEVWFRNIRIKEL